MINVLNRKKLLPLQISAILLGASASLTTLNSYAQDGKKSGVSSVLLEELIVTARKTEELASETPIAISAYGADQLEALKVRDLTNLAVGIPNVALDDVGTSRGVANFSIRGLGINSSVPSIDPTVGIFVDGVYMGLNNGIIFDTFDMQSIEILRGPQGIAFGRNVTGGAVQLTTKLPGQEFAASAKVAVESGGEELNKYFMASIGGPLSDSVSAKISVYSNRDDGWFKNEFTGDSHGEVETDMYRPVVTWDITEDATLIVRYEHSETESDGPAAQSHTNGFGVDGAYVNFDRDSHKYSIDEEGFLENEIDFVSIQYDQYVDFGDGTITNIFGWRDFEQYTRADIDSSPENLYHGGSGLLAEQFSNELRYNGTFGKTTITTGLYYFENEINYHESRELIAAFYASVGAPAGSFLSQDGGGNYEVESLGVFVTTDYEVNDNLILSAGVRFTKEEKEAEISNLYFNTGVPCNVLEETCTYHFIDDEEWTNVSPKLGFGYALDDQDANIYGHWTRGIRSGGYNLRDTAQDPTQKPGPFDEETVDTFELGYKLNIGQRGRFNAAIFYTNVDDMQREINEPSGASGVTQRILNTADATLMGIELDTTYALTDEFLLTASLGYVDSEYDKIKYDLTGDGNITSADKDLDIPRAAELTYSLGVNHDTPLGDWGHLSSRISYAFRDESAYTDNNRGYIDEQKILDAGIDLHYGENLIIGLYGKNLTDEVKHGGDTQLPDTLVRPDVPLGGTFAPLSKGRVYGLEVVYNY